MSKILVTGGAGYLGSHVSLELLQAGHGVVVLDNLSNSSIRSLEAVKRITNRAPIFQQADLRDATALADIFSEHTFDAVLHFGGLKAVAESVEQPALYYDNNVIGSLRLIEAMQGAGVKTLVFSSSATVYGVPKDVPIDENCATAPINPYGRTKLHIEQMLHDTATADPDWRISLLRYFNPVGAHASGEIGEDPNGIPNNLVPYVSQVAIGKRSYLNIFGGNYPTPDGTGIRDYIHVSDLARGHIQALEFLNRTPGIHVHNLGTGKGFSVLEVLSAMEAASGKVIPYRIVDRRIGDAAISYADPKKANSEFDWVAKYDLTRICDDVWRWQSAHPDGFRDAG